MYRRIPGARRVVVAGGARLGLARGLPRDVARLGDDGQPLYDPNGEPIVDVVTDLPAAERFFAGGDNTVRGFAQDRLGEPATLDRNGLPTGGNALVVFNTEVRVPVWRGLVAAAFVDAGNVFQRVSGLDLGEIRGAAGFGVRYLSPIGPIRVDLGFKLVAAHLRQRHQGGAHGAAHHGRTGILRRPMRRRTATHRTVDGDCEASAEASIAGRTAQRSQLYLTMHQRARTPSFQPIFLPSS